MASLSTADSLDEVAQEALAVRGAAEVLRQDLHDREIWEQLLQLDGAKGLLDVLERYVERHGHRAIGELKLETMPPGKPQLPEEKTPLLTAG